MPANAKEVKLRLQSIKNTKKITKAMELVAAAKMRKAVAAAVHTRAYHETAWGILERLLNSNLYFESHNPDRRFFTQNNAPKQATIIAFTSNRGLCGSFNSNVVKRALKIKRDLDANVTVVSIGNRGASSLSALGMNVEQAYKKNDSAQDDNSIREIAAIIHNKFRTGETDRVYVAYTEYKSALNQTAVVRQLFPFITPPTLDAPHRNSNDKNKDHGFDEYIYEPDKFEVLASIIPRMAEVELYQALLESNASEHSARMVAMKNAAKAAGEMAEELLLIYNKARQAGITQEIAEISAGRMAITNN